MGSHWKILNISVTCNFILGLLFEAVWSTGWSGVTLRFMVTLASRFGEIMGTGVWEESSPKSWPFRSLFRFSWYFPLPTLPPLCRPPQKSYIHHFLPSKLIYFSTLTSKCLYSKTLALSLLSIQSSLGFHGIFVLWHSLTPPQIPKSIDALTSFTVGPLYINHLPISNSCPHCPLYLA